MNTVWPEIVDGKPCVIEPITDFAQRVWFGRRSSDFTVRATPEFFSKETAAHAATLNVIHKVQVRQSRRPRDRRAA